MLFREYNFGPHVTVDLIKVFVYSRFSSRKSQSQWKLAKIIPHLQYSFPPNKMTHFTNLNFFDIENNMLPKHSQKAFSVYKFSSKYVSVWCQENHLHWTISWRPRTTFLKHFESECLYVSVHLSKNIFASKM